MLNPFVDLINVTPTKCSIHFTEMLHQKQANVILHQRSIADTEEDLPPNHLVDQQKSIREIHRHQNTDTANNNDYIQYLHIELNKVKTLLTRDFQDQMIENIVIGEEVPLTHLHLLDNDQDRRSEMVTKTACLEVLNTANIHGHILHHQRNQEEHPHQEEA